MHAWHVSVCSRYPPLCDECWYLASNFIKATAIIAICGRLKLNSNESSMDRLKATHIPHFVEHNLDEVWQAGREGGVASVVLHQHRQQLEEGLRVLEHWVGGPRLGHNLKQQQKQEAMP